MPLLLLNVEGRSVMRMLHYTTCEKMHNRAAEASSGNGYTEDIDTSRQVQVPSENGVPRALAGTKI